MDELDFKLEDLEVDIQTEEEMRLENTEITNQARELSNRIRVEIANTMPLNHPLDLRYTDWFRFPSLVTSTNVEIKTHKISEVIPDCALYNNETLILRFNTSALMRKQFRTISSKYKLPYIESPDNSYINIITGTGNHINGFIYRQSKLQDNVSFNFICYVPFDESKKKVWGMYKGVNTFAYGASKIDETLPIIIFPTASIRNMSSRLTEIDEILIESKYTKKTRSRKWRTLNDAINGINTTITEVSDPNYIYKLMSLNCEISSS